MIHFCIIGTPKGKGRPRFTYNGKFVQTYTDKETRNFENYVKLSYLESNQESFFNNESLRLEMKIYQEIPESVSKKKKERMIQGIERPTKKPDIDNVLKSILDGLNKVAFYDDKQIIEIEASKFYSMNPRIEVCIKEIENSFEVIPEAKEQGRNLFNM